MVNILCQLCDGIFLVVFAFSMLCHVGTDWFSELMVLLKSLTLKRLPLHICDKEQRHNIERVRCLYFLKTTNIYFMT